MRVIGKNTIFLLAYYNIFFSIEICYAFMISFKENLITIFDDNLLFLGLQGSYGRGEAKGTSDIEHVVKLHPH